MLISVSGGEVVRGYHGVEQGSPLTVKVRRGTLLRFRNT
jgi:hypothetical protein